VPHALWRARLLRLKRTAFNSVAFCAWCNFHEPEEGKSDLTGDHNLFAWL